MEGKMEKIASGRPFFGGIASGQIKIVRTEDDSRNVSSDDIVVATDLPPSWAANVRKAAAIGLVGIEANHAVGYFREIWKPGLLFEHLPRISEGLVVTFDCNQGVVLAGEREPDPLKIHPLPDDLEKKVYLQLGIPWMAKKAASLGAAGVSLFRSNLMIQELGVHPLSFIETGQENRLESQLADGICEIAASFPVSLSGCEQWILIHAN